MEEEGEIAENRRQTRRRKSRRPKRRRSDGSRRGNGAKNRLNRKKIRLVVGVVATQIQTIVLRYVMILQ